MSLPLSGREGPTNLQAASAGTGVSRGLEWLWAWLQDNPNPRILDCGPTRSPTVTTLAERGCRLYVGDLLSLVGRADGELWDRTAEQPVFRTERLLSELPPIPAGSISVAFCWQLLDLLPREVLPEVVRRMFLYLQPGGVLFFILREPHLKKGADTTWQLETLTRLAARTSIEKPFPYPCLSNSEVQRLIPAGTIKTVLTRSGMREVLVVKERHGWRTVGSKQ